MPNDGLGGLDKAIHRGETKRTIEADILSFLDSIDGKRLGEMLELRVADGAIHRLIGKCLHVGILDGEEVSKPDEGTTQGSILSPLLGNIYLHYVLDLWLEREVKPRLDGKAILARYADDFVIGFELESDARKVMEVLPKRMQRYGLKLHPDKTRLFDFRRPPKGGEGKDRRASTSSASRSTGVQA